MTEANTPFPEAPEKLQDKGKAAWVSGEPLWASGVLGERDLRAWETYCRAIDEVEHCDQIVAKEGEYFHTSNGACIQHPAINRRRDAERVMWRYEQAFGLVPDKRTKRPSANNTKGVAKRSK